MRRKGHQPERVHRVDRLRHLIIAVTAVGGLAGCSKGPDAPKPEPVPPRTAAVTGESDPKALATFCDKSWPGEGAVQPWGSGPATRQPAQSARGSWRWVNFWATWCAPCRVEMPAFEAAFQRHGDTDFTVLAVNNAESAAAVQAFRQELDLSFPLLVDLDGAVQYRYGIKLYPSTFLIDADGAIIARHFGALTEAQLDSMLASALGS